MATRCAGRRAARRPHPWPAYASSGVLPDAGHVCVLVVFTCWIPRFPRLHMDSYEVSLVSGAPSAATPCTCHHSWSLCYYASLLTCSLAYMPLDVLYLDV